MNREQMIEVVERALDEASQTAGESLSPWRPRGFAVIVVDALVAAGCVPSDALTEAAWDVLNLLHGSPLFKAADDALDALANALYAARGVSATPEAET